MSFHKPKLHPLPTTKLPTFPSYAFFSLCIALAAPCTATQPGLPTTSQPISIDSINLRADVFFNNLTSQSDQVRERAQLFLLGVQDATEGKSWCGYRAFKTITLREDIYEYFKKLPHERLAERAAVIIEEALHKNYPCKARK